MTVVVHQPVVSRALPDDAAGARIERDDLERVAILHADAVGVEIARPQVVAEVIGGAVSRHALALDGRGQEDAIVQTTGDECPRPAIAVFHAMFLSGDHSSG